MAPTPRVNVNPQVLTWARELGGFTLEEVARAAGTKPARAAEWEAGESKPTLGQLKSVAWLLRRPPAFFFRASPPAPDLPQPPDFRRPEEQQHVSPQLRRELRSAVERRGRYLELVGDVAPWMSTVDGKTQPETAAAQIRAALELTVAEQISAKDVYQAMHRWTAAVESLGAIVFQSTSFPLGEARGVSVFFEVLPVILVNAKDPVVARSFTLLHELGHLCLGSGAVCDVYGRRLPRVETWCNRFAASVLMPAQEFLEDLGVLDPAESVGRLARRYKVSEEAAAIRLFELDRLDRATLDRIRAETRSRVEEKEAEDEGAPTPVPYHTRKLRDLGRNYVGAVLDAYHSDKISLTEVSQYLDVKVPHVWKMQEVLDRAAETRA